MLDAISRAQEAFLVKADVPATFEGLLACLLKVTQSQYGFIGEALLTGDGKPYLKTHAITDIPWNEGARQSHQEEAPFGLDFFNMESLFSRAMKSREPVIANSPAADARRAEPPEGHPPLANLMVVPFVAGSDLLGMLGIANRTGGYDPELVQAIEPLRATCSNIIAALRSRRSHESFERQLTAANQELREEIESRVRAESVLSRFFDLSLDLLCVLDAHGHFEHLNPAWEAVLGYTLQELKERPLLQFVHPLDRETTRGAVDRLADTTVPGVSFENRCLTKDGTHCWLRWTAAASQADGKIYAVARDFTEERLSREREESRLQEFAQRAAQMDELSEMGELLQSCISIADVGKVLRVYLARVFSEDTGVVYELSADRTSGDAIATFGQECPRPLLAQDCWALRRGRAHRVGAGGDGVTCGHHPEDAEQGSLCVPLMAQGEARGVLHLTFPPGQSEASRRAKEPLAITIADQIALAMANIGLRETLREQSIRDPLTGLFNRRYMTETLERELHRSVREQQPLSVVLVDLDHFKRFNDMHGHVSADVLLADFARYLADWYRKCDVVCRYGGEEFLVIMPGAEAAVAAARTESARQGLDAVRGAESSRSQLTFSAGVACSTVHGAGAEQLVRAADTAMYRAKQMGRNQVCIALATNPPPEATTLQGDAAE